MKIPEVAEQWRRNTEKRRELCRQLAELDAQDEVLRVELKRRTSERGPVSSRPMTPKVREQILWLNEHRSEMSQLEIATLLNIGQGRVSEVLRGYRT
jgi:hypothetical protein